MGSGAGYANLGLAGANFAAGLSGNQTAQGLMNTLGTAAAYAFNPASALGMFFGLGNLFRETPTVEEAFWASVDSHPAFGANRIGETQEHSQGAHLGYLGNMANLRQMAQSGYRTPSGVDANQLYNRARAWTLADVMANPYGTMVPNRYGESHEYAYGPNRQVPTRDPRVLGQMLDDDLDIYDTNWGAQLGEGANGGLPGRLTFLDAEQRARIQRQGTLTEPVMPGEPLYNYNTNTV